MTNLAVPARIRRIVSVEGGLSDGIATPVVVVAIAGAGAAEKAGEAGAVAALAELAIGLAAGAVVGGAGGWLVRVDRGRGWVAEGFAGAAVLGLALCAYAPSVALGGNGFVAAFTGGLAFAAAGGKAARMVRFVEETGSLLSLLAWLMFGAAAVATALTSLTWQIVLYAVASLTVIRMLPVAIALTGSRLGRPAAAFMGWSGPRGLASVVFALLALEDLGQSAAEPAVAVIAATVLLSVLAHGLTAGPLATRYGASLTPPEDTASPAGLADIPGRRLIRRSAAAPAQPTQRRPP